MEGLFAAALVMAVGRLGSLNALEQRRGPSYWRRWVGGKIGSADTMGRGFTEVGCQSIRDVIKEVYSQLKRNKRLKPLYAGLIALIIDGHESHCSKLRKCDGCLERNLQTRHGVVKENYHRHVMASLLCHGVCVPLDMEPQRPGEDEVTCAMRLLERILKQYPRAFDLILADGLYAQGRFFKLAKKHGKDVVAVLKDERRDVLRDAQGLFKKEKPTVYQSKNLTKECWDIEHFMSWPQAGCEVRVVCSRETRTVKRQKTKAIEAEVSEWVWVTTASQNKLGTHDLVKFGHKRWCVENNGFNELVNQWHANHVYKHNPTAIEAFGLLTMLAYILFHAFIDGNLKPVIRQKHSKRHWAQMITAEIYARVNFIPP